MFGYGIGMTEYEGWHPTRVEMHRRYPWLDEHDPPPFPELEVTRGQLLLVRFTDWLRRKFG